MAYIPPHKRILRDKQEKPPSPTPYGESNCKGVLQTGESDPIANWFIVPSVDANNDDDPYSVPLKLVQDGETMFVLERRKDDQIESIENRSGVKPIILVCHYLPKIEVDKPNIEMKEIVNNFAKSPWMSISKEIQLDILTSFQNVRSEMCSDGSKLIKPCFVVRFGRNLLHGISLDDIQRSSVKSCLGQFRRTFLTQINVEPILDDVISKLGVDFYAEKEYYHVKVFDKYQKHGNITCKCSINKVSGVLDICKDDAKQYYRKLIKSAILDPEMKGGLRWPFEMESLGNRYSVIGVLHTKSRAFINSSMRLKSTLVDRFNFRSCTGEVREEVILEMTEINMKLRDATTEPVSVTSMVDDTLKLLWERFP